MNSTRRAASAVALILLLAATGPRAVAAGMIRMVMVGSDSASAPAVGSFRKVLTEAQPGDTIQFAQPFSITFDKKDPRAVKFAQSGVTIQGPAELRAGVMDFTGDGTTITGMRFADFKVFAGALASLGVTGRTKDFVFRGNTLAGESGLMLTEMDDSIVEDNTFDVRAFQFGTFPFKPNTADTSVADYNGAGSRWANNTWTDTSLGGFEEADGTNFVFDKNTVVEDCRFRPRSGVISANVFKNVVNVFHFDGDGTSGGVLTLRDNTCGALVADRPSVEVTHNTVTGVVADKGRKAALSASAGSQPEDAGFVRVRDNTVTATQGWVSAAVVRAAGRTTECLVSGNAVMGGKRTSLAVSAARSASVTGNTVTSGGKVAGIAVSGAMADGLVLEDNVVDGASGAGIEIAEGTGAATLARNSVRQIGKFIGIFVADYDTDALLLDSNTVDGGLGAGIVILKGTHLATLRNTTVNGCKAVGLHVLGRRFVSEDGVYRGCGRGVLVDRQSSAVIRAGSISGNTGAGLYADTGAGVEVVHTSFSGNGGPGIDLAPAGVTPNTRKKKANGNVPFPASLTYDDATGRVKGKAEPLARIDAYAVETGARAGNPKNGEGETWLGEAFADASGDFAFPQAGRLTCPPSKKLTFTATRLAKAPAVQNVTSEFSEDVACGVASAIVLVSRAVDGTPGNSYSRVDSSSTIAARERTMSDDGRYVVFQSQATNLVAGDTNGVIDVFLRDTVLNTTTRVNRDRSGAEIADGPTMNGSAGNCPSISADGRFVVYSTHARAVFEADVGGYNDDGVVLFDTQSATNTIIVDPSVNAPPPPSGSGQYYGGFQPSVSGDGSAVAFASIGNAYVAGDAGTDADVFVWTRATGAFERVSIPTGGGDVTNGSNPAYATTPRLSYDARFAVFGSRQDLSGGALPVNDRAWLRDRQAGTTETVSFDSTGVARNGTDAWPSDDGRFVVFASAEALVAADTNTYTDVYLRDRQAATTTLISATLAGVVFSGDSFRPSISGDGRYIAFKNHGNVWLLDRQGGTLVTVSGGPGGPANGLCDQPCISRTGQFVRFETDATNLVDLGGQAFITQTYLRDLSVTGK